MRIVLFAVLLACSCGNKADPAGNTPDKQGWHGTAELSPVYNVSKIAAKFQLAEVNGKDVELKGTVTGMDPGTYVMHYHQPMGCDPMAGDPKDTHISELGTIQPDANGSANVTFTIRDARLSGMKPIDTNCLVIFSSDGSKFLSYGKIYGTALGIGH